MTARRAAFLTLCTAGLVSGCDATVTSVGAWEPVVAEAGAAGQASGGQDGMGGSEARTSQYLEAESGELSGGFSVVNDASASNDAYLEPPLGIFSDDAPGEARARYLFTVPADGSYRIWGRIYAPTATNNRFWFQLDGGTWYRWRISTGEIWYWDDLHDDLRYSAPLDFQLAAGEHELVLANCAAGAKLDRLYITAQGDEPPGNDTSCSPPHSIDVAGECLPSCGSHASDVDGPTTCVVSACEGQPLLEAYDCNLCCYRPAMP